MYRGISDTSWWLWKQNWGKKHIDVVLTLGSSYFMDDGASKQQFLREPSECSLFFIEFIASNVYTIPKSIVLQIKCYFVTTSF